MGDNMAHYKDVIKELLVPEDKLSSVIDTFNTIGEILEERQRVKKGEYISTENIDKIILKSMYVLGFYPFYNAHGAVLRPLLLQAFEKENPIVEFFSEAIPTALTIAMPHKQEEYFRLKKVVRSKLES